MFRDARDLQLVTGRCASVGGQSRLREGAHAVANRGDRVYGCLGCFCVCLCFMWFLFFPSFPFPPSCLGVPGCFRHSWEPFFSLGVSLGACVVAGNAFFSFPFFFFFLLFSPYPTPPSCGDLRVGRY